jgi:hypothetical protein
MKSPAGRLTMAELGVGMLKVLAGGASASCVRRRVGAKKPLQGGGGKLGAAGTVGAAVGREMREFGVDLWLAPGTDVMRSPSQRHVSRCWSEEPVLCGLYTAQLAKGVGKYGAAVLRAVSMEHKTEATQRAYQDVYSLGFSIAAESAKAVLLPSQWLNEEPAGEDTPQSQALIHEWRFGGMFLADDERFTREPDRIRLEQAALKILKFALTRI